MANGTGRVRPVPHLDLNNKAQAPIQNPDQWETGTIIGVTPSGKLEVSIDGAPDSLPTTIAPADSGVTAIGATVRLKRDSAGHIASVAVPDVIPDGETPVYLGATGQFVKNVADAQVELDADLAKAREDIASAKQDVDHLQDEVIPELNNQIKSLDETAIPGLAGRVDEAEQKLSPLPGRISATESAISVAQEDLDNLNDVKLPALSEATKDAARLTEGTLDNDRIAIGELSALIANVIQLNVSQLVASDAAINSAVINKLSVGIANVISLSASRITSGQLDAARINVAELAVELATVIHLDVSQLVASNAAINSAVISKLSVGIADVIELNVSRLVASDAHLGTAVAQRIVADTATFLKITTEMLIAGGAKITGPLLADTIQLATRLVAGDPSGSRTELDSTGLHVFQGSTEKVQVSASAKNGLRIWDSNSSQLVDLADSTFGSMLLTSAGKLTMVAGSTGTWGAWVGENFSTPFISPTSRCVMYMRCPLGDQGVAQNFYVRGAVILLDSAGTQFPVIDTGAAVTGASTLLPNGAIPQMGVNTNLTPGATYTVRAQFQASKAPSGAGTPWVSGRNIVVQPI